ncbi:MAG: hypothetical protein ACYDG6_14525 [Thermincolia bacterium]
MSLVGLNGQPMVSRQQRRQMEKDNLKNTTALIAETNRQIGLLFIRTDILIELLKERGVTDEQINAAEAKVRAEYKAISDSKQVQ